MKKNLANIITASRGIFSLIMLFVPFQSTAFAYVHLYCGLSDVADGFIARKTKTTSKFGSKLDGACDLLFYTVMMIKIWPHLKMYLPTFGWVMIWFIFIVRLANYVYIAVSRREFYSTHNILNKATGTAMFLLPLVIKYVPGIFVRYSFLVEAIALAAAVVDIYPTVKRDMKR